MTHFLTTPIVVRYTRYVQFAVEVLDPVTLERVYRGVQVNAEGLDRKPIMNHSGYFVFLRPTGKTEQEAQNDFEKNLRALSIDPGQRPFSPTRLHASEVTRVPSPTNLVPVTSIYLSPLENYPFPSHLTAILGKLFEAKVPVGREPVPVADAQVHLEWKPKNNPWRRSISTSRVGTNGSFCSVLRFTRDEAEELATDGNGKIFIRLIFSRVNGERMTPSLSLSENQITYPKNQHTFFYWNELHNENHF